MVRMSNQQTLSVLQRRFAEIGLMPDARHGQNFLIDQNLLQLLLRAGDVQPNDVVLEVGTGTGGLTALLAEQAAAVITVEIDQHLHTLASETLLEADNVVMLQHDVLKNKNRFDPRVIEAVQHALSESPDRRFKLVANLPYNVATPVITNLLDCETVPVSMTVTIQKELADRILAPPRSKDYSSLSIWIQSQCETELVRVLAPSVFWPRPKVTSAILHIRVDEQKRQRIPERWYFHQFVRAMFIHRRKFLRSNLLGAMKRHFGKPEADEIMAEMGFSGNTRAEEIDVETMIAFCETVRRRASDWSL